MIAKKNKVDKHIMPQQRHRAPETPQEGAQQTPESILLDAKLPYTPQNTKQVWGSYEMCLRELEAVDGTASPISEGIYDEHWSLHASKVDPIFDTECFDFDKQFHADVAMTFIGSMSIVHGYLKAVKIERLRTVESVTTEQISDEDVKLDEGEFFSDRDVGFEQSFMAFAADAEMTFRQALHMLLIATHALHFKRERDDLTSQDSTLLFETAKWTERAIVRNTSAGRVGYQIDLDDHTTSLGQRCELFGEQQRELYEIVRPLRILFKVVRKAINERRYAMGLRNQIGFERDHRKQLYTELQRTITAHKGYELATTWQTAMHETFRTCLHCLSEIRSYFLIDPDRPFGPIDRARIASVPEIFRAQMEYLYAAADIRVGDIDDIDEKVDALKAYLHLHCEQTTSFIQRLIGS